MNLHLDWLIHQDEVEELEKWKALGKDGLLNWVLSWVWDSLGLGVGLGVCVDEIYIALAMESANEVVSYRIELGVHDFCG